MDEELTKRFAELRAHDRSRTPSFEAVLGARRIVRRMPLRLAVAFAALLVVTVVVYRRANRFQPVALADWRSPTAFLLATPGTDLLGSVPSVTSSVIRIARGDTI